MIGGREVLQREEKEADEGDLAFEELRAEIDLHCTPVQDMRELKNLAASPQRYRYDPRERAVFHWMPPAYPSANFIKLDPEESLLHALRAKNPPTFQLDYEDEESNETGSPQNADWSELGLNPILTASLVANLAFGKTTPVQRLALPAILSGQDVITTAETGSGKTLAFVLPICHLLLKDFQHKNTIITHNTIRCLILSPTREIAMQTHKVINAVSKDTSISSTVICGGTKHVAQEMILRKGVNFVCACPGRLLDVLAHGLSPKFKLIRHIVLDEADRMLGLGFSEDVESILNCICFEERAQMLLFSASLSQPVLEVARKYMSSNVTRVGILEGGGVCRCENIKETTIFVPDVLKLDMLRYLLKHASDIQNAENKPPVEFSSMAIQGGQCIVFTRTKARANRVCEQLRGEGYTAERIHGNRSQAARVKALRLFIGKLCQILVATDVAARGIDMFEVPLVVNFDLPTNGEEYIHRSGRTGRAGREGHCWSFITSESDLTAINESLGRQLPKPMKIASFDYQMTPAFILTASGHREEISPAPNKPSIRKRSTHSTSNLSSRIKVTPHRRHVSCQTVDYHRRRTSGTTLKQC